MFRFSLSAKQSFQQCEQAYAYRYVDRLSPKVKAAAPQMGIILHEYLAGYYKALVELPFGSADEAHGESLAQMRAVHTKYCLDMARAAQLTGDDALAQQYADMPGMCERICERYYRWRGGPDAEQYDVIMVEERLELPLQAGIVSEGVLDLVLRDRFTDRVWLVDHKSTKNVPNATVRTIDFQTLLYQAHLQYARNLVVDGVLWNYIRTVEPGVPKRNSTIPKGRSEPDFSRAAIDTTWEIYSEAVAAAGDDPERYEEMRPKLGTELGTFFPRSENVIVAKADILMDDYATIASRARLARQQWEAGSSRPVRNVSRSCAYCTYVKLCEAVITGGDEASIIPIYFTKGGKREENATEESITGTTVATRDDDAGTASLSAWSF